MRMLGAPISVSVLIALLGRILTVLATIGLSEFTFGTLLHTLFFATLRDVLSMVAVGTVSLGSLIVLKQLAFKVLLGALGAPPAQAILFQALGDKLREGTQHQHVSISARSTLTRLLVAGSQ